MVIGSRGSQLALWQARHIASCLQKLGVETRLEIIKTTGDKITDVPLAQVGGKGLFTKEIEEALLAGNIDLAVHSLKDMPTGLPPGLTLAAIPEREDHVAGMEEDHVVVGRRAGLPAQRLVEAAGAREVAHAEGDNAHSLSHVQQSAADRRRTS